MTAKEWLKAHGWGKLTFYDNRPVYGELGGSHDWTAAAWWHSGKNNEWGGYVERRGKTKAAATENLAEMLGWKP